jgi:NAD(P)-dependent dehydrogenase (short-subunit alcohol dehydrogenase family)
MDNQTAGWTTRDIPDQSGRTALITGGNGGLGYQAVLHLARKGARVLLAARDRARGTAALERLAAEGRQATPSWPSSIWPTSPASSASAPRYWTTARAWTC